MKKSQYHKIREKLLKDYWSGSDVDIGYKLPTERTLASLYQVSRATVGKAIATLAAEGLVTKRQGSGIYIASMMPNETPRMSIAFVTPDLRSTLNHHMFEGIERVARSRHFRLEVTSSNWDIKEEQRQIGLLRKHGAPGAIVSPLSRPAGKQEFLAIEYRDFPIVVVDLYQPQMNRSHLIFDNFSAGFDMTQEIMKRGHRVIAFLKITKTRHRSIDDRLAGYRRALEDAGEEYVPERIMTFNGKGPLTDSHVTVMKQILALNPRPTALITSYDPYAHGSIIWLRAQGIAVPDEMLVAGFGNRQQEIWEERFLTTKQNPIRMGELAAEMLIDQLEQRNAPIREVVLPSPLLLPEDTQ